MDKNMITLAIIITMYFVFSMFIMANKFNELDQKLQTTYTVSEWMATACGEECKGE